MEEEIRQLANHFYVQLKALNAAAQKLGPEVAETQRLMYENLVDQGFTEDEALELLKHQNMNAQSS